MQQNKEKLLEIFRYLVVGALTTVVSLGIYYGLVYTVLDPKNGTQLQIANILSWIGAVIFAYFTNRKYVFKSKNVNKLKEASKFIGSRVLTLIMDMAIMLVGVTILKGNDKIMKLVSQVVVTVSNYIFSKLFVFKSSEKKGTFKLESKWILLFIYILDLSEVFLRESEPFILARTSILSLFFLYVLFKLWQNKNIRSSIIFVLALVFVEGLYFYTKDVSILESCLPYLGVLLFPFLLVYFYHSKDKSLDRTFLTQMFYLYLFTFLILTIMGISNTMITMNIIMLPVALDTLFKHHNYLAKLFGLALIVLEIMVASSRAMALVFLLASFYVAVTEYKKKSGFILLILLFSIGLNIVVNKDLVKNELNLKDIYTYKRDNLKKESDYYFYNSMDNQLFGMIKNYQNTTIDLIDYMMHYGVISLVTFTVIFLGLMKEFKVHKIEEFTLILFLILSIFYGNLLTSASVIIMVSTLSHTTRLKKAKKILLVTNMYPSKKYPHYGSFIKNTKEELEDMGFAVTLVAKKKNISYLSKLFHYSFMYLKAIYLSLFHSYDYFYVHFISQTGFAVILGALTSYDTKVIFNVHGNDVVPDTKEDEKNVKRSQFNLRFADLVVVPSSYFKAVMVSVYHVNVDKIVIYPSGGVNLQIFHEIDKNISCASLGLDPKITYLGYVGRIEKDKGWDDYLYALNEMIKDKKLCNIQGLIVGDGTEKEAFDKLIHEYHLENHLIIKKMVSQEELVKYYNAMDLLIFPTKRKSESLGLVGLEAMACETLAIINDSYGPRTYAKNLSNCFTYEDKSELISLIKKALKLKKKDLESMLSKASLTVKKYDSRHIHDSLKEIFK